MARVIPSTYYSVDNTGEARETISAIKGNYSVTNLSLCTFLWFFLIFIKFTLTKQLEKQKDSA